MSRAVYEDDVIKLLNRGWKSGRYPLACDVRALPSAQPDHLREPTKMMERETGRWVILRNEYGDIVEAVCSNCHMNGRHEWAYCPHCGADMRGDKHEVD